MSRNTYKVSVNTGFTSIDALVTSLVVCAMISVPLAWITHFVWIIKILASDKGATAGQMVLGALGAFMPPVGIVHGYLIWLGVA